MNTVLTDSRVRRQEFKERQRALPHGRCVAETWCKESACELIDCICQIDFSWLVSKIWKRLAAGNFQKKWMV
jgi:hypothetical protein